MKPTMMCLCEIEHLTLRLGRPYIFQEGSDCPKCKVMADNARAAYGPDGGADAGEWQPKVTLELPQGDTRSAHVSWVDYDPDLDKVHVCLSVSQPTITHPLELRGEDLRDSPVNLWLVTEKNGHRYTVHRKALAYVLLETGECTVEPLGLA